MRVVTDSHALHAALRELHASDRPTGFVPTMGNLHAGHLRLVEAARRNGDAVIVSIFVNPLQFGPDEDLERYPRTPEEDQAALRAHGVELLYLPPVTDVYPAGMTAQTRVTVPGLSEILCGAARPGHFSGVATVVNRLFNLVGAPRAYFGKKDYQQLLVIRKMVNDLAMPIDIVGIDTVREDDGLAMSSRNRYLDLSQRRLAPRLYAVLRATAAACREGTDPVQSSARGLDELAATGFRPDYLEVRRRSDLGEPAVDERELVVLAAAWLGQTRLIDNLEFERPGNPGA